MNARVAELRERSLAARPAISAERSLILTRFYREHLGRHSTPVLRALAFRELCERKTIVIAPGELIVGERGPAPKVTPLFPELTCHSEDDLRILDTRPLTSYAVPADVHEAYAEEVIPYWRGRTLRDRVFEALPPEWHEAYEAGLFTEFMEQRAPGHTVADGKIYAKGMDGFVADVDAAIGRRGRGAGPAGRSTPRGMAGDAHRRRGRRPVRRAPRGAGRHPGRDGVGPRPPSRARPDRRCLPARARPAAPRLLGGGPDVLVLPSRRHHRAQRLGCLFARPPRPAPGALLPARDRGRDADPGAGEGAPRVPVRQVQQPSRTPQGGRHRRGERHVHGLRGDRARGRAARRHRWRGRRLLPAARGHRRAAPGRSPARTSSSAASPRSTSCARRARSSGRAMATRRCSTPTAW